MRLRGTQRLLICDLDGTLLNNSKIAGHCMAATVSRFGLPEPELTELDLVTLTRLELCSRLAANSTGEVIRESMRYFDNACREMLRTMPPLFPHALEVVREVKAAGVHIAILSARDQADLTTAVTACGLDPYVDLVVGVAGPIRPKPDVSALDFAIQPAFSRIHPEEMLVCGDLPADLGFAHATALDCCWASYGYGDPTECARFRPAFTISDIRQLPGVLRGIQ